MMLVFLVFQKISTSSCEFTDNELVNSDTYKAFLNNVMSASKQLERTDESGNKIVKDRQYHESPYERFIRNLRTNWEMPMNYLQERGYLQNADAQINSANNELSMNAFNLINGPSLNPSTSKNVYPIPHGPNSIVSMKTDRDDRATDTRVGNE